MNMKMRTKTNKSVITSVVLSLMMVFTMLPSMVFAAQDETMTIVAPTTNMVVGTPYIMTVDPAPAEGTHIDWSVENKTGKATISKHKGQLVASEAGTVTVTATLRDGEATSGSGGGDGSGGGQECTGTILATASKTYMIRTTTAYGFQGLGGNGLMMTNPSTIIVNDPSELDGLTKYNNVIEGDIPVANNVVSFGYTMSAGINNFQKPTFDTYQKDINIYDLDGNKVEGIAYGGFANRTVTITADAAALTNGGTYILRFGPSVCGNNSNKKLACYIDFKFTVAK